MIVLSEMHDMKAEIDRLEREKKAKVEYARHEDGELYTSILDENTKYEQRKRGDEDQKIQEQEIRIPVGSTMPELRTREQMRKEAEAKMMMKLKEDIDRVDQAKREEEAKKPPPSPPPSEVHKIT